MSAFTFILAIAVALGGLVEWRRRDEPRFILVMGFAVIVAIVEIATNPAGLLWTFGLTEGLLFALAAIQTLDLIGLPPSIARRVRIGLRSKEWEFDRQLHQQKKLMDKAIARYPSDATWESYNQWKSGFAAAGDRALRRMRALKPPDAEWGDLRSGYVELYEEILSRVVDDEPPDEAAIITRGAQLRDRGDALRARYRAAAQALLRGDDTSQ